MDSNGTHATAKPGGARPRLTGYPLKKSHDSWWKRELARVCEVDGLPSNCGIGMLFSRIAENNLKLDRESIERFAEFQRQRDDQPA